MSWRFDDAMTGFVSSPFAELQGILPTILVPKPSTQLFQLQELTCEVVEVMIFFFYQFFIDNIKGSYDLLMTHCVPLFHFSPSHWHPASLVHKPLLHLPTWSARVLFLNSAPPQSQGHIVIYRIPRETVTGWSTAADKCEESAGRAMMKEIGHRPSKTLLMIHVVCRHCCRCAGKNPLLLWGVGT